MLNISVGAVKALRSSPGMGLNHYGRVRSLTHYYRDVSHWVPVLPPSSPPPPLIHHFPHLLSPSSSSSSSFPAVLTCHVYLISFPREEVFRFWRWWWWRRCVCVSVSVCWCPGGSLKLSGFIWQMVRAKNLQDFILLQDSNDQSCFCFSGLKSCQTSPNHHSAMPRPAQSSTWIHTLYICYIVSDILSVQLLKCDCVALFCTCSIFFSCVRPGRGILLRGSSWGSVHRFLSIWRVFSLFAAQIVKPTEAMWLWFLAL